MKSKKYHRLLEEELLRKKPQTLDTQKQNASKARHENVGCSLSPCKELSPDKNSLPRIINEGQLCWICFVYPNQDYTLLLQGGGRGREKRTIFADVGVPKKHLLHVPVHLQKQS